MITDINENFGLAHLKRMLSYHLLAVRAAIADGKKESKRRDVAPRQPPPAIRCYAVTLRAMMDLCVGAPDSIGRSIDRSLLLLAPPMDGHMSYDPLMIGTPTVQWCK